jgi:hypothetical protein
VTFALTNGPGYFRRSDTLTRNYGGPTNTIHIKSEGEHNAATSTLTVSTQRLSQLPINAVLGQIYFDRAHEVTVTH